MMRFGNGAGRACNLTKANPSRAFGSCDASSMTSGQPYSILITDDDPAARETLREICGAAGIPHTHGREWRRGDRSGPPARGSSRPHGHALAPAVGLETIAIVRQIKGVIPAILITADQDDNLMRRALSEHAFCVLAKPVSKHVVIYVVHKAIEKYYN